MKAGQVAMILGFLLLLVSFGREVEGASVFVGKHVYPHSTSSPQRKRYQKAAISDAQNEGLTKVHIINNGANYGPKVTRNAHEMFLYDIYIST